MTSNPPRQEPASHAEMSSDLHAHLGYWQAPKQVETLERLFSQSLHPSQPNAPITHCVCIGVGAFQRGRVWPPARYSCNPATYNESLVNSPMNQLAFLVVLLKASRQAARPSKKSTCKKDSIYNDMENLISSKPNLGYHDARHPLAFSTKSMGTWPC